MEIKGIKTRADVLHIEDEGINQGEMFSLRFPPIFPGIETHHGKLRLIIHPIFNLVIKSSANAVFWAEEQLEIHFFGTIK